MRDVRGLEFGVVVFSWCFAMRTRPLETDGKTKEWINLRPNDLICNCSKYFSPSSLPASKVFFFSRPPHRPNEHCDLLCFCRYFAYLDERMTAEYFAFLFNFFLCFYSFVQVERILFCCVRKMCVEWERRASPRSEHLSRVKLQPVLVNVMMMTRPRFKPHSIISVLIPSVATTNRLPWTRRPRTRTDDCVF